MNLTACTTSIQWLDDSPATPCVLPKGHDGQHQYTTTPSPSTTTEPPAPTEEVPVPENLPTEESGE